MDSLLSTPAQWQEISAHLRCTVCGTVGYVDTRNNWSEVINFNKGVGCVFQTRPLRAETGQYRPTHRNGPRNENGKELPEKGKSFPNNQEQKASTATHGNDTP
jgi:hypothetical protein